MSITKKAFVVENDDEPNGTDTKMGILPARKTKVSGNFSYLCMLNLIVELECFSILQ